MFSAPQATVSFAVEDDRHQRTDHAQGKQEGVTFRLQRVAQYGSDHEGDADGNGEGNGESGHVDGGDQQQVGEIKDGASDQRINDIGSARRVNIVGETGGIVGSGSHGVPENESHQEDADGVVPVEKLEAVILHTLVGVGP